MFTVQSRVEFDAAHFLIGSNSPCDMLHGHRWKVDVVLSSEQLTKVGFVINFTELKAWMKDMTENLDHNLANYYLPQTTAENLCLYFFMYISDKLKEYNKKMKMKVKVAEILVSETPNNTATYRLYDVDVRKEKIKRKAIEQWENPASREKIHNAIISANESPELRHIRSIRMAMNNPMSKREVVTKMLRSLRTSKKVYPNAGETKMIDFFKENNIPLTFCGNGDFILDGKIPDFVNYEKKVVVEYNGRFWHSKNDWNDAYDDSQERIKFFKERGYQCYIIWDDEFESKMEQIKNDLTKLLS